MTNTDRAKDLLEKLNLTELLSRTVSSLPRNQIEQLIESLLPSRTNESPRDAADAARRMQNGERFAYDDKEYFYDPMKKCRFTYKSTPNDDSYAILDGWSHVTKWKPIIQPPEWVKGVSKNNPIRVKYIEARQEMLGHLINYDINNMPNPFLLRSGWSYKEVKPILPEDCYQPTATNPNLIENDGVWVQRPVTGDIIEVRAGKPCSWASRKFIRFNTHGLVTTESVLPNHSEIVWNGWRWPE